MRIPEEILKTYWGFPTFRPNQKEIIGTILSGEDVLALLPTGGGKSICFQVPALCMDGLCLVVSPLVALMQDQVENLKRNKINAYAITSALAHREVDRILDNCVYGDVKFLYVSPERLQSTLFIERFKKMKISFIAVDEAHCISQWGYDFRPPYLQIAEIRELKPDVAVMALTASATVDVVQDIMDKLKFKAPKIIKSSFARPNLSYLVEYSEDKENRMLDIISKTHGSCIVYCNSRQQTRILANRVAAAGITAGHYHAGMAHDEREMAYQSWKGGDVRVMCATNAFGMGIDKPDVRLVVHLSLPQSLEAYFQEAGRGGRDGGKSYAVLLYNKSDLIDAESKIEQRYPSIDNIRKVYRSISSILQLAIGAGMGVCYEVDLHHLAEKYELKYSDVIYSLQILSNAGFLTFEEKMWQPSRLMFLVNKNELYSYQVANPQWDIFIRGLLRTYGGLFENYVNIHENELAKNMHISHTQVYEGLNKLKGFMIVDYQKTSDAPKITFLTGRMRDENIILTKAVYADRMADEKKRMKAIRAYVEHEICRSVQLLSYFGEKDSDNCGVCDICRKNKTKPISEHEYDNLESKVNVLLTESPKTIEQILESLSEENKDDVYNLIRWKLDHKQWVMSSEFNISIKNN